MKNRLRALGNVVLGGRSTFCPLLYDSVFIAKNGDVYTCCGMKPGPFGNIGSERLSVIWERSLRLKSFRMLSAHRALPCFFDCAILSKREKAEQAPSAAKRPLHPGRVWLLYGEICNLDCVMCPQDHRARQTLDNEVLKRQIDWGQVEEIEMQGGEILAMENARKLYLWLTRELGKKVNLITNGVLVDDTWAEHLVMGSDWVQISVNAATKATHELVNRKSNFERVIGGIEKLVAAKRRLRLPVRIVYKFTAVSGNVWEMADAIVFAERLGCDEIHFGFDLSAIDCLKSDPAARSRMSEALGRLLSGERAIEIERYRLEHLGLIA